MLAESFWSMVLDLPQLPIILGCLIPIIGIISSSWYKVHKVRSENDLKQSMVERGMSADEIERVMTAKSRDHDA